MPRPPFTRPRPRVTTAVAIALLCTLTACAGGSEDPPATPRPILVTASVADPRGGPTLFEIEVLRTASGAHAAVRTPAGLLAEELTVGDRYYVRVPDAAPVVGTEDWILLDRTRPSEASMIEVMQPGALPLADVDELVAGDLLFNEPIESVDHDGSRWFVGLGGGIELVVVRDEADAASELPVPGPDAVVTLADLRADATGG